MTKAIAPPKGWLETVESGPLGASSVKWEMTRCVFVCGRGLKPHLREARNIDIEELTSVARQFRARHQQVFGPANEENEQ